MSARELRAQRSLYRQAVRLRRRALDTFTETQMLPSATTRNSRLHRAEQVLAHLNRLDRRAAGLGRQATALWGEERAEMRLVVDDVVHDIALLTATQNEFTVRLRFGLPPQEAPQIPLGMRTVKTGGIRD